MAQPPSQKMVLGAQMTKEFLGEDLLSQLQKKTGSNQ